MKSAIVVGAGIFGACTARELARRGWRVQLLDPDEPGTVGPSAAAARVFRAAYGARTWYTALARQALPAWLELERESGAELFDRCGVLYLISDGDDGTWEDRSVRALRQAGAVAELLRSHEVTTRFDHIRGEGLQRAVFEPEAGVLDARACLLAIIGAARAAGVRTLRATARPAGDARVEIDGETGGADVVIWAVGPALPALFPEWPVARLARQDTYHLAGTPSAGPAWLDVGRQLYGLPAAAGRDAIVVPDVETDVGTQLPVVPRLSGSTVDYLRLRFPSLSAAAAVRRQSCFYAATVDDHFLLDRIPGHRHSWLVGGDSGHGFKHGPAWGCYVADAVEGRIRPGSHLALSRTTSSRKDSR